jgi:hypothetical protein
MRAWLNCRAGLWLPLTCALPWFGSDGASRSLELARTEPRAPLTWLGQSLALPWAGSDGASRLPTTAHRRLFWLGRSLALP